MTKRIQKTSFVFHNPGTYRIVVFGVLDKSWSERLGGLKISSEENQDHGMMTCIEGRMRDQAELSGVLNTLYEHHFTLLSVQYLQSETSNEP
jgi:hypothetical protein